MSIIGVDVWNNNHPQAASIHAQWLIFRWYSPCFRNCQLAFTIAEQKLGITCLLDVCDVARAHPPDRLSILTYVSQFYHRFQSDTTDSGISSPSSESRWLSANYPVNDHDHHKIFSTRRGGVHSLLSNRRSRSVSASPPIEKENPFRREFLGKTFVSDQSAFTSLLFCCSVL